MHVLFYRCVNCIYRTKLKELNVTDRHRFLENCFSLSLRIKSNYIDTVISEGGLKSHTSNGNLISETLIQYFQPITDNLYFQTEFL